MTSSRPMRPPPLPTDARGHSWGKDLVCPCGSYWHEFRLVPEPCDYIPPANKITIWEDLEMVVGIGVALMYGLVYREVMEQFYCTQSAVYEVKKYFGLIKKTGRE